METAGKLLNFVFISVLQPLDTVEFEKLCVRKLKLTAKKAMAIAEKLYMKGFISYPRLVYNTTMKYII